jgi:hypothetical protein
MLYRQVGDCSGPLQLITNMSVELSAKQTSIFLETRIYSYAVFEIVDFQGNTNELYRSLPHASFDHWYECAAVCCFPADKHYEARYRIQFKYSYGKAEYGLIYT